MESSEFWNTKQAAEYLGVSDRTVRTLCDKRQLKHRRLSGRIIQFKQEWLDDYLKSITFEPQIKEENLNE